jgi:hypothetical protein
VCSTSSAGRGRISNINRIESGMIRYPSHYIKIIPFLSETQSVGKLDSCFISSQGTHGLRQRPNPSLSEYAAISQFKQTENPPVVPTDVLHFQHDLISGIIDTLLVSYSCTWKFRDIPILTSDSGRNGM